jgi:serine/threonine protein phosphatase PrpC
MQACIAAASAEGRLRADVSGTTGSVVLLRPDALYCAWVGDSRVAVGLGPSWTAMRAQDLSWDHKPELPAERKRIEASGGAVRKNPGDIPHRVCTPTTPYPGLAMSRSFGDLFAATLGVTHEPTCSVQALDAGDEVQVLILCSDGIWEFLSTEEVVAIVRDCGRDNLDNAVDKLCRLSWDHWIAEEGNVVDDLTAVVVDMQRQRVASARI